MDAQAVIFPMFALFVLTIAVLVYGLVIRVNAIRREKVHPSYFKVFAGNTQVPERILQQKNHVDNLFQVPVLFYAVCLMALSLNRLPAGFIELAWSYVALRICHSGIHLTYNKVIHRMPVFVLSNIILVIMWLKIVGESFV